MIQYTSHFKSQADNYLANNKETSDIHTWAGKRDSPRHFLSSQAEGSMLVPPKLAAYTINDVITLFRRNALSFVIIAIKRRTGENCLNLMQRRGKELGNKPQKLHGAGEWSSCKEKGASPEWSASLNRGIGEANLHKFTRLFRIQEQQKPLQWW